MVDSRGSNLPDFRSVQLDFAAHIRNPETHPRPADVSARRMQIYLDLFYKNVEGFLAGAFPVAKRVLGEQRWHGLARRFVHEHPSTSPYFLEISQEFLSFLDQTAPQEAPDFLLELCHYEWVELAINVDERELPGSDVDAQSDLQRFPLVLNPVLWVLSYRYPVHQISPDFQPQKPPAAATLLAVYRDSQDQVRFLALSEVSYRLLGLLQAEAEAGRQLSGSQVLGELWTQLHPAAEAQAGTSNSADEDSPVTQFLNFGATSLAEMRELGIILGTQPEGKSGLT